MKVESYVQSRGMTSDRIRAIGIRTDGKLLNLHAGSMERSSQGIIVRSVMSVTLKEVADHFPAGTRVSNDGTVCMEGAWTPEGGPGWSKNWQSSDLRRFMMPLVASAAANLLSSPNDDAESISRLLVISGFLDDEKDPMAMLRFLSHAKDV